MKYVQKNFGWFIFFSSFAQMLCASSIALVPTLLPIIQFSSKQIAESIGTYISIIYATAAISALLCAWAVVQKRVLISYGLSVASCILGVTLCSIQSNIGIVLSAVCIGFGYGLLTPLGAQVASHLTTKKRGMVLSLRQAGVPAGSMLAGAVFPWIYINFGYDSVCLVVAFITLILGGAAIATMPEIHFDDEKLNSKDKVIKPEMALLVYLIILVGALFAGIQMSLQSYLMAYLINERTLSIAKSSMMMTGFGAGGICFRIILGSLSDYVETPAILLIFIAGIGGISCYSMGSLYSVLGDGGVLLCSVIIGACAYGWNGIYLLILSRSVDKHQYGSVFGYATFVTNIGAIFLPLGCSYLILYHKNLIAPFYYIAVAYWVIGLLVAGLQISENQREKNLSDRKLLHS